MKTTVIQILKSQLSKKPEIKKAQISALSFLEFIQSKNQTEPQNVLLINNLAAEFKDNPWVNQLLNQAGVIDGQNHALAILKGQYQNALLTEFENNRDILTNLKKQGPDTYSLTSEQVFKPFAAYRAMLHFMNLNHSNAYFDAEQIKHQSYEKYSSALTINEISQKLSDLSGDTIKNTILTQY